MEVGSELRIEPKKQPAAHSVQHPTLYISWALCGACRLLDDMVRNASTLPLQLPSSTWYHTRVCTRYLPSARSVELDPGKAQVYKPRQCPQLLPFSSWPCKSHLHTCCISSHLHEDHSRRMQWLTVQLWDQSGSTLACFGHLILLKKKKILCLDVSIFVRKCNMEIKTKLGT